MYLVCRLLLRCPARFTLFPYTTLFRSREVDIAWTAAFVRRNVEIRAGGKIARSRAAIGRKDKQVAARALVPVGPVAVKKVLGDVGLHLVDRKSTRLNSSHRCISYAVFCFAAPLDSHSFPTRRSSDLEKLISPGPPRSSGGTSKSAPEVRSRGAALPSAGRTNKWLRVPSFQWVQWR